MILLRRYFRVLFKKASMGDLIAFATDHLQRMVANNPGDSLNALITPTTVALTALGQCSSSDTVRLGIRKAAKDAKNAFREALPGNIRRIAQRVAGHYGEPSGQITACFPEGREIYRDCRDDQMTEKLTNLVTALTPLAAAMGPTALSDAGGLLSTWIALYAASEAATGAKTTTEDQKADCRAAVERQLTLNVLALAAQFLQEEEKCDLYFQQYLLGTGPGTDEEEEPEPPAPPPPGP